MKKRRMAFALALLLAVQLLCLPSASAEQVYFTAVNETVLELTESSMPFWSGGYLYVASTVFSGSDELGFSSSRNQAKQTLVFWMPSQENNALVFDLAAGTVTDGRGEAKYPGALVRGSTIFVPVGLMAASFGLSYTNTPVSNGYLVRVRNSRSVLSDAVFADAAASQMAARYEQYRQSKTAAAETEPVQPDEADESGRRVYLCIQADDAGQVETLLNVLNQYHCQATFYCTESFLKSGGDLLRRMEATGQGIGLLAENEAEAQRLNRLLFAAVSTKTRLVRSGADENRGALTEAGLYPLQADLDRERQGLRGSGAANALLERVTGRSGSSVVWLGTRVTAAGLGSFLGAARGKEDRMLALTETAR